MNSVPWVIAHRGVSARFPENSLAAFDEAVALGVDGLELDLQLTADGVVVVFHDRTLKRVAGVNSAIHQLPFDQIRDLDIGTHRGARFCGQRIPRLEVILERYPVDLRLFLEIKMRDPDPKRQWQLTQSTLDLVLPMRSMHAFEILCYAPGVLEWVRDRDPRIRRVLNMDGCGVSLPVPDLVWAYSIRVGSLSGDVQRAARAQGKRVYTFTCNTHRQMRHALECHVDAIMSDDAARLQRWLVGRGNRNPSVPRVSR